MGSLFLIKLVRFSWQAVAGEKLNDKGIRQICKLKTGRLPGGNSNIALDADNGKMMAIGFARWICKRKTGSGCGDMCPADFFFPSVELDD
ncbi:hypothetical protein [Thermoactinomyces mirandus]|uniref:hypothetical protein n=1 Tax=Thermoactinomyces mirandus TaxID=2756294 RepID=UPI0015EE641C|nr:hypothetical protein [Thermoactinomyces mirandus]